MIPQRGGKYKQVNLRKAKRETQSLSQTVDKKLFAPEEGE